jgi:hypothetical protein
MDADQIQASKNVSDDYDQVAAFFDIMGSLLERLSLLESKLPSAKNYKTILMQVFSSLMGLCGTATKYVTDGRFSKKNRSSITENVDC